MVSALVYLYRAQHGGEFLSIQLFLELIFLRGHSITTWTRRGEEGSVESPQGITGR